MRHEYVEPRARSRWSPRAIIGRRPWARTPPPPSGRVLQRHEFVAPDAGIPPHKARIGNSVLMPLSMIPLVIGVTHGGVLQGIRSEIRDRWGAPTVAPDPTLHTIVAARRRTQTIPVLVYHGISTGSDKYAISQVQFAKQMATFSAAGYQTVSPAQYVAWRRGEQVPLPRLPLLITFDDGRVDSYLGSDAVLERYGYTATMFVEAGTVSDASDYYLNWRELRHMAATGRWSMQVHSGKGHTMVPTDAHGASGPFYANRRYGHGRLETIEEWQHRVDADLALGVQKLRDHGLGDDLQMFAVLFGDVGQLGSNDPTITTHLMASLGRHFPVVFLSDEGSDVQLTQGAIARVGVRRTSSLAAILRSVERMRVGTRSRPTSRSRHHRRARSSN